MVLKLIGACMTLGACGSMGLVWAGVHEKRPRQLTALEGALQLLETEITYGATPLPEAMEQVAGRCDPQAAGLFMMTAREFAKMGGVTAAEAWERALGRFFPATALDETDLNILIRFGASLGISDRQDQAKHLKLAMNQLKAAAGRAEAEARKNSNIFKYLGFLGGMLLVLILY